VISEIIGKTLIVIGLFFVAFGVFGIFRFGDFYSRILVSSKVDTVGFATIIIGMVVREGLSFFSAKAVVMMIFAMATNPIATHAIAQSAYVSGHKTRRVK